MAAPLAHKPPVYREIALATIGLAAILVTQLAWVGRTNFAGFDEWLIIDLVSRGIIDVPHGNRPVQMLWHLPAALCPYSLTPYLALHAVYSFSSGALVFVLCRRLAPGRAALWLLTAVFSVVWGPGDLARLSTLERTGYAAFSFGALAAICLLVESWRLGSVPVLAFGTLIAFLVARSYEAVVPILVFAPALLMTPPWEGRARFRIWVTAWEGVLALAILLTVRPALFPNEQMQYQLQVLGLDLHPGHVAGRLLRQYLFHLAPVILSPPSELVTAAVPVAVVTFAALFIAWAWLVQRWTDGPGSRPFYARSMIVGALWAGLGYSVLVLTPAQPTALRMQILSAPGIALCLASVACLAVTFVSSRWRLLALGLMAAWVIAVGTGRTVAMQKTWDAVGAYPTQVGMLVRLTREVPDVKPHTLFVLLDQGRAWRATYGFRHAVQYLYQRRAIGYVRGAWDALYPTFFTAAGIRVEPWPALREAWGAPVTLYRYDETIVVRHTPEGRVEVLEAWPDDLQPLPPGERYDPGSRIVTEAPPPPERAILGTASKR
jgi:hypothetical protein